MAEKQAYNDMGLEKFYEFADAIIDDLEAGRTKGEDVIPKHKPKTIEDTVVRSTDIETGEDNVENLPVIGKVGKRAVIVTPLDGSTPKVYGSVSVAARAVGLTPTTVKQRCDNEKTDSKGNTWSYKDV